MVYWFEPPVLVSRKPANFQTYPIGRLSGFGSKGSQRDNAHVGVHTQLMSMGRLSVGESSHWRIRSFRNEPWLLDGLTERLKGHQPFRGLLMCKLYVVQTGCIFVGYVYEELAVASPATSSTAARESSWLPNLSEDF